MRKILFTFFFISVFVSESCQVTNQLCSENSVEPYFDETIQLCGSTTFTASAFGGNYSSLATPNNWEWNYDITCTSNGGCTINEDIDFATQNVQVTICGFTVDAPLIDSTDEQIIGESIPYCSDPSTDSTYDLLVDKELFICGGGWTSWSLSLNSSYINNVIDLGNEVIYTLNHFSSGALPIPTELVFTHPSYQNIIIPLIKSEDMGIPEFLNVDCNSTSDNSVSFNITPHPDLPSPDSPNWSWSPPNVVCDSQGNCQVTGNLDAFYEATVNYKNCDLKSIVEISTGIENINIECIETYQGADYYFNLDLPTGATVIADSWNPPIVFEDEYATEANSYYIDANFTPNGAIEFTVQYGGCTIDRTVEFDQLSCSGSTSPSNGPECTDYDITSNIEILDGIFDISSFDSNGDGELLVSSKIEIKSAVTIDGEVIKFGPNGNISVHENGRLILKNGATLTSCSERWIGVKVGGQISANTDDIVGTPNFISEDIGTVIMYNGSTIENAVVAIDAGSSNNFAHNGLIMIGDPSPYSGFEPELGDYNSNMGKNIFKNNLVDIKAEYRHSCWGATGSALFNIKEAEFIRGSKEYGIQLKDASTVRIFDCEFSNSPDIPNLKSNGIYIYNTHYHINDNTFDNLLNGTYVFRVLTIVSHTAIIC